MTTTRITRSLVHGLACDPVVSGLGRGYLCPEMLSYLEHYSDGTFAPYLRERRIGPGVPVVMLDIAQPAGDFSDPPIGELAIVQARSVQRVSADFGAGRVRMWAPPGRFVVVAPGVATTIVVDAPHAIRVTALDAGFVRPLLRDAEGERGDPFDFGALHRDGAESSVVTGLLETLWVEAAGGDSVSRLYTEGATLTLLATLRREATGARTRASGRRGGLAGFQLARIREYLEAHLADDVSLAELAALANLSVFHFNRAFKQSTGLPPHRYLVRLRVERAARLLNETRLSVATIAAQVGYDDPNQLARVFRKETGMSPLQYRRAQ